MIITRPLVTKNIRFVTNAYPTNDNTATVASHNDDDSDSIAILNESKQERDLTTVVHCTTYHNTKYTVE